MLGSSLRLSLSLKQTVSQRIVIHARCTICGRILKSERERLNYEQQIHALESKFDPYTRCIECWGVPKHPASKAYRARVRARVTELRDRIERHRAERAALEADQDWPEGTKSLQGQMWIGLCPLDNSEMLANNADFFECVICHLQIQTRGEVVVMPKKGMADYKLFRWEGGLEHKSAESVLEASHRLGGTIAVDCRRATA